MINIEDLKLQIIEQLEPLNSDKIILFGSYAYGTPNEDSDKENILSIDEIKKLNTKEKISLMNQIWESLETENTYIESPRWHQEILESRVSKIKNNEAKFISLEDLKRK